MKIIFNGFTEEFDGSNVTIRDILNITNEDDPGVIVEVNGRFVYRKDFSPGP